MDVDPRFPAGLIFLCVCVCRYENKRPIAPRRIDQQLINLSIMTTSGRSRPLGPFKLVTVNTAPERARMIVGRLCEEIKDSYLINHVANSTSEHGLPPSFGAGRVHLRLLARLTL